MAYTKESRPTVPAAADGFWTDGVSDGFYSDGPAHGFYGAGGYAKEMKPVRGSAAAGAYTDTGEYGAVTEIGDDGALAATGSYTKEALPANTYVLESKP